MEDIQLSKNFKLSELVKSDAGDRFGIDNYPDNPNIIECLRLVVEKILQPCRNHFGPIRPSSGYRCPQLNALVGSTLKSQHMLGQAVDFEVVGVTNYDLAHWIWINLEYDQLILECYKPGNPNSGWVHCSVKSEGNRHEELTFDGKSYLKGLVQ